VTHRHRIAFAALLLAAAPDLAGAAPVPPASKSQAKPAAPLQPKAGDTIDLSRLDYAEALSRRPTARDPAMSALALKALRTYAAGGKATDPADKAIAKRMAKVRNGRKIAKRILARIDALPPMTREATFGPEDPAAMATSSHVARASSGAISPLRSAAGLLVPNVLPAEGVLPPSTYALKMTGLATQETSDGDADGDEVVVVSTFVHAYSTGGLHVTHSSAAESSPITGLTAGAVTPLDRAIYDGKLVHAMLVTAAFEVDGDEAAAREDYFAMWALAEALAQQLAQPGDQTWKKTERLSFALDYTVALLVAGDTRWGPGALVKTMMTGAAALSELHATPPATDGAVPWRLAHHHDLPAGDYKVYFDVPAPPVPARTNLKVKIIRIESLDGEQGGDDLVLDVAINGAQKKKTLTKNKNVHELSWTVQRLVNPGKIQVRIALSDVSPGPKYAYLQMGSSEKCGDWPSGESYAPCPDVLRPIDLDPGNYSTWDDPDGRVILVGVDTETGTVKSSHIDGMVGETMTISGTHHPRGKLKLLITMD
jgi:hypothetical protein